MSITVARGAKAAELLDDETFRAEWSALYAACPFRSFAISLAYADAWRAAHPGGEMMVLAERDAQAVVTGLLVLCEDDGWRPLGNAFHTEAAWLAAPLLGSYFMERAVLELSRHLPSDVVIVDALAPNLPSDWASRPRRAGRYARATSFHGEVVTLEAERATRPIEKKANTMQLAAIRKVGAVRLNLAPDIEALRVAFDWYDVAAHATAKAAKYDDVGCREQVVILARDGHLFCSELVVDDRCISVFVAHRSGERFVLELLAEDGEVEAWAPSYLHWLMLEPELLARGVRKVDVSAGPDWLKWLGTTEDRHRVSLFFGSADRLRFDARVGAVDLGKWALRRLDRA